MKAIAQRLYSYPQSARLLGWGRLLFFTGSAQVVIQLIGLACGILVVRLLSTKEYALYTLANTILGTMTVLADGGISRGVMAEGGKVWQQKERLGAVLATGLQLRRKFAIVSLVCATPLLWYLLSRHGTGLTTSALIIFSLVPAFYTALYGSLLETGPKLHQDISGLQKLGVAASIGRLGLLLSSLFVFPWAFVAILAAGLSQLWQNRQLKKISLGYVAWSQRPDLQVRTRIVKMVKRLLPESLYYCFSGQITIWLLSFFGTTESIAQIGALQRLAMVLNFFTVLMNTLVIPRFARLPNNPKLLMQRHLQVITGTMLLNVLVITLAWIFSAQVLWVLGPDYASLTSEVVLVAVNACLGMFYGVCFSASTSRGWVMHPLLLIGTNLLAITAGVLCFNITTLSGILLFNILVNVVQIFVILVYNLRKISEVKNE